MDRNKRAKEVSERIQKVLFDIIEEENRFRLQLESRMEAKKRELAELTQQLGLPPYFPPRNLPSYRLLALLDEKAEELSAFRARRIADFRELRAKAERLSALLDVREEGEAAAADHFPAEEELRRLSEKVQGLEDTYKGLVAKYAALREDVVRIAADIDYAPSSDFEAAVLGAGGEAASLEGRASPAKGDAAPNAVLLTPRTLEELQQWRLRLVKQKAMLVGTCDELRVYLQAMWLRLQLPPPECEAFLAANAGYKPAALEALQAEVDRCQELKWERTGLYLANLRAELGELCAKCFVDPSCNGHFSADEDSEECINALEQEIDRLRELYAKNRAMYDAVYNYQRLWEQYVEVEQKMKDPAILSNRGGILLKTDKEKKRLLKELPKVEQEVAEELAAFEAQNGAAFLLPGRRTFADYVRHLWSDARNTQRSASATRRNSRLKPQAESPSASPRRKL